MGKGPPWAMYDKIQGWTCHRMPRHVKDLRPMIVLGPLMDLSDICSECEGVITVGKMPDTLVPITDAANTSSDDSSAKNLRLYPCEKSTRHKRPPPDCIICDQEIGGGG